MSGATVEEVHEAVADATAGAGVATYETTGGLTVVGVVSLLGTPTWAATSARTAATLGSGTTRTSPDSTTATAAAQVKRRPNPEWTLCRVEARIDAHLVDRAPAESPGKIDAESNRFHAPSRITSETCPRFDRSSTGRPHDWSPNHASQEMQYGAHRTRGA
ncbi:MAG: hypothetical protein ACXV6M_04085 [Ilumatobacteraceae bacterium]